MDTRTQLIVVRAQELFLRDHPGQSWLIADAAPDVTILARQAHYLALAEDQLLAEGVIDCIDQT